MQKEILYSALDKFINSMAPEEVEKKGYYDHFNSHQNDELPNNLPNPKNINLSYFCHEDIGLSTFNLKGLQLAFTETGIIIYNKEAMIARNMELSAMTDEEQCLEIEKATGYCDGGDDLDYQISFATTLADLLEDYLNTNNIP